MNISIFTQSIVQPTFVYVPVQPNQLHIHHHYNVFQQIPIIAKMPQPSTIIQQQIQKSDQSTKIEKYEKLTNQVDKLFAKINQIDQNIHQISTSFQSSSPQRVYEKENESTKYYSREIFQPSVTPPRKTEKFKESSIVQEQNQQNLSLDYQNVKEQISRIELMKGIQFGEYIYFGELNKQQLRHGYGTLYDLKGRIIYTGQWYQDQFHDRGKLFFYDLVKSSIKLELFQNQQLVYNNRTSYTGQFEHGQIKGLGQMLFIPRNAQEKFIFYGRFDNGVFSGRGTVMHYFESIDSVDSLKMFGNWRLGIKV